MGMDRNYTYIITRYCQVSHLASDSEDCDENL